jgi:hypothetical protein
MQANVIGVKKQRKRNHKNTHHPNKNKINQLKEKSGVKDLRFSIFPRNAAWSPIMLLKAPASALSTGRGETMLSSPAVGTAPKDP